MEKFEYIAEPWIDELARFVRPLAGPPLTILLVIRLLGGFARREQLSYVTGWEVRTIKKNLDALILFGYIKKSDSYHNPKYFLSDGVAQLSFLDFQSEKILQIETLNLKILEAEGKEPEPVDPTPAWPDDDPRWGFLASLHMMGIGDPMAVTLANLPHVTQDYIDHFANQDLDAALVIHKIRNRHDLFKVKKKDRTAAYLKYAANRDDIGLEASDDGN